MLGNCLRILSQYTQNSPGILDVVELEQEPETLD